MAVLRLWWNSDQKTNRIFENIFGVEDSESEIIFPKFEFLRHMPLWLTWLWWTSDRKTKHIFESYLNGR